MKILFKNDCSNDLNVCFNFKELRLLYRYYCNILLPSDYNESCILFEKISLLIDSVDEVKNNDKK